MRNDDTPSINTSRGEPPVRPGPGVGRQCGGVAGGSRGGGCGPLGILGEAGAGAADLGDGLHAAAGPVGGPFAKWFTSGTLNAGAQLAGPICPKAGALNSSYPRKQRSMSHHMHKVTLKAAAGTGWNALQEQLETAHEEVQSLAISGRRHGVLITRHSHDTYTVAVSPEVPYGMTCEREGGGIP